MRPVSRRAYSTSTTSMNEDQVERVVMKTVFAAGMGAAAAAVALTAGAQQPQYSPGLWESTVIIERYATSDGKPSTRDKKVERICIVPGDEKSMVPMFSADVASKL